MPYLGWHFSVLTDLLRDPSRPARFWLLRSPSRGDAERGMQPFSSVSRTEAVHTRFFRQPRLPCLSEAYAGPARSRHLGISPRCRQDSQCFLSLIPPFYKKFFSESPNHLEIQLKIKIKKLISLFSNFVSCQTN